MGFFHTKVQRDTTATEPSIGGGSGSFENIGFVAATTTNANDSIKVTGANGTALSTTNPGYVRMLSATSGLVTTFTVTADVTILLTGAHWGFGTKGDLTSQALSVLAINSAGTLRWGVALHGGVSVVLDADDSATPTDINLWDEVLVSAALTADSYALHLGHFFASFDDTGGAAEDLWAVASGVGSIVLGSNIHYLRQQKFNAAEVTSTGDVAALTFSNLRAGDKINISGNFYIADTGSNQADVNFIGSIEDVTTDIYSVRTRLAGTIDIDSYGATMPADIKGYTMVGTAINFDVETATAAGLQGSGAAGNTEMTLSLLCIGGCVPKACVFS